MIMMIPVYIIIILVLLIGAKRFRSGEWNDDYTSLKQTKSLLGFLTLGVALHHMGQKTCAPWHPAQYTVHGLDMFVNMGFLFVSVFLFCSGMGLYKSFRWKADYLKGFIVKRIVPIIIAFYLSEFICTLIRYLMKEPFTTDRLLWYLSGLRMANMNSWYVIIIPFFYLAFYLAFKFCKKENTAITFIFIFTFLYTFLGISLDHQNVWWMRGEWWYNSIILFPLGILFAKHETAITDFVKKRYRVLFPVSVIAVFITFYLSRFATGVLWGYYGENWGDPFKHLHRFLSVLSEWTVCICFTAAIFLFLMKVSIGNRLLNTLGKYTLEFYLMHGMFVEIFGYNFLDIAPSLIYIRNVPLYIAVVIICAIPLTAVYHFAWKGLVRLICRT